jgi:hypothetical protein
MTDDLVKYVIFRQILFKKWQILIFNQFKIKIELFVFIWFKISDFVSENQRKVVFF